MSKFKGSTRLATADIDLFESDGYLSDATITCGDRTWNVHKLILGSRCEWLRAAFYGNMKEARQESTSGDVVLEEQDPKLVDIMLRFIYAKDIDIPKLSNGKDTKAIDGLQSHFYSTLNPSGVETCKDQSPPWLTEVLDAVEEAYADSSTAAISKTLARFVCDNSHGIFNFSDAVNLLDKIPKLVGDIRCNYRFRELPEKDAIRSRQGLAVYTAIQCPGNIHAVGDGPAWMYPVHPFHFNDLDEVFMTVNPETDLSVTSLAWMTPSARIVKIITGHQDSAVVQLRTQAESGRLEVLYICFRSLIEAELCVERYCRVNPKILRLLAPSFGAPVLWDDMQRAVARGFNLCRT